MKSHEIQSLHPLSICAVMCRCKIQQPSLLPSRCSCWECAPPIRKDVSLGWVAMDRLSLAFGLEAQPILKVLLLLLIFLQVIISPQKLPRPHNHQCPPSKV